eukprot:3645080-Rhodomonas_salina.1
MPMEKSQLATGSALSSCPSHTVGPSILPLKWLHAIPSRIPAPIVANTDGPNSCIPEMTPSPDPFFPLWTSEYATLSLPSAGEAVMRTSYHRFLSSGSAAHTVFAPIPPNNRLS